MATKKRKPRSSARAPKRASTRATKTSSLGSFLALGAIIGIGALSIWATTQHKSPQTALTRLFDRNTTASSKSPAQRPATLARSTPRETLTHTDTRPQQSKSSVIVSPAPRPSVSVGAQSPKPVQQATLQPQRPAVRPDATVSIPAPLKPTNKTTLMAPRGVNVPNMMPSVVYARERVTIRRNAWDKAPPAGTVEKGREMRSYGKTGKWHRIVVPATDMIGWVHEEMLIAGKAKSGTSPITTGSIPMKAPPVKIQPSYPPRPVGAQ